MAARRVEDYLLVECAKWHGQLDLLIAVEEGFDMARHFGAQLAALVAVGLLSGEEAEKWGRMFAGMPTHSENDDLEVDEQARDRVRQYLESLADADGGTSRLDTALNLLEELGVLPEAEVNRWFERTLEEENEDCVEDLDEDEDPRRFVGTELLRVLPGPAVWRDGVRVVSVELYDDGILVRWSGRGNDAALDALIDAEIALGDDLGTDYEELEAGASGGGSSACVRGHTAFSPAMPQDAARVFVDVGRQRVELTVRP